MDQKVSTSLILIYRKATNYYQPSSSKAMLVRCDEGRNLASPINQKARLHMNKEMLSHYSRKHAEIQSPWLQFLGSIVIFFVMESTLLGGVQPSSSFGDLEVPKSFASPGSLTTFYEDREVDQLKNDSGSSVARIKKFECGVVGNDRILLKVTFSHPLTATGSTFRLYIDLDDNRETGRKDVNASGVDLMFSIDEKGGRFYFTGDNDLQLDVKNTAARFLWDSNELYITIQTTLPSGDLLPLRAFCVSENTMQKTDGKSVTPQKAKKNLVRSVEQLPSLVD